MFPRWGWIVALLVAGISASACKQRRVKTSETRAAGMEVEEQNLLAAAQAVLSAGRLVIEAPVPMEQAPEDGPPSDAPSVTTEKRSTYGAYLVDLLESAGEMEGAFGEQVALNESKSQVEEDVETLKQAFSVLSDQVAELAGVTAEQKAELEKQSKLIKKVGDGLSKRISLHDNNREVQSQELQKTLEDVRSLMKQVAAQSEAVKRAKDNAASTKSTSGKSSKVLDFATPDGIFSSRGGDDIKVLPGGAVSLRFVSVISNYRYVVRAINKTTYRIDFATGQWIQISLINEDRLDGVDSNGARMTFNRVGPQVSGQPESGGRPERPGLNGVAAGREQNDDCPVDEPVYLGRANPIRSLDSCHQLARNKGIWTRDKCPMVHLTGTGSCCCALPRISH